MCRQSIRLLAIVCLLSGCASITTTLPEYEANDLMVVHHNEYNNCLLMVYRDALGQTQHVFRKDGVTEIVLTYKMDGAIELKMRGSKLKVIEPAEAGLITQRINSLLEAESPEKRRSVASI